MRKGYKIKRYNSIYKKRWLSPLKLVVILASLAVVVFLGFSLYGPVTDLIQGRLEGSLPQNPPGKKAGSSSSSSASASEGAAAPTATPKPTATPSPTEAPREPVRAVFVPHEEIVNGNIKGYVEGTGLAGINSVMINLKEINGTVRYNSALTEVAALNAQSEDSVSLSDIVKQAGDLGYRVVGRIYAFRDATAPKLDDSAGIKNKGGSDLWLDASVKAGGSPWLNPYSETAQSYLLNMIDEITRSGVSELVLSGVQFPTGQALENMTFNSLEAGRTKSEVIKSFFDKAAETAAKNNASVIAYTFSDTVLGESIARYGDVRPQELFGSSLGIGTMPASFGTGYDKGGINLVDPVNKPYETILEVMATVQNTAPSLSRTVAFLQGYSEPQLDSVYGVNEVNEQIRALSELSISEYIVLY